MNISSSERDSATIFCILNASSALVCLLAAILVFALKLYSKLVYRLALYQVLASFLFAMLETIEIISFYMHRLCDALAYLIVYSQWMKLLFTMWVAFHLFCLAELHKNLKKLEVLYVVTSLLVPALIAAVPLVTHTYGVSPLGCYIYSTNNTDQHIAFIERFTLWDAPAMTILVAASIAMIVVIIKFARAVSCRRSEYEPIAEGGDQYWKALTQLIPLAAFPMLFFLFVIPEFVYGFSAQLPTLSKGMELTAAVFISMWGMSSGTAVVAHITVVRLCTYRSRNANVKRQNGKSSTRASAQRVDTFSPVKSTTHFSAPNDT